MSTYFILEEEDGLDSRLIANIWKSAERAPRPLASGSLDTRNIDTR